MVKKLSLILIIIVATLNGAYSQTIDFGLFGILKPMQLDNPTSREPNFATYNYGMGVRKNIDTPIPITVGIYASFSQNFFQRGVNYIFDNRTLKIDKLEMKSFYIDMPLMYHYEVNEFLHVNGGIIAEIASLELIEHLVLSNNGDTEIVIDGHVIKIDNSVHTDRRNSNREFLVMPAVEFLINFPFSLDFSVGLAYVPNTEIDLPSETFNINNSFAAHLPALKHQLNGVSFFTGLYYKF